MYNKDLYLFLTNACPNRCKYCYIKYGHLSMTEEDIDKYIDIYKPKRIIFFGGEPLVRIDLYKYTVKKYWNSGIRFQLVTSTMSNWNEFVEFYKEYPIKELQISWDGWRDSRIGADGKSISEKVYGNIIQFAYDFRSLSNPVEFDVKCVINNHNVKDLLDIHNLFKVFNNKLRGCRINGQFVIAHGEDYDDQFYKDLERQLYYTFDLDKMYVEHMNKLISYLDQSNGCSCDIGKYITISPTGIEDCCTALSQTDYRIDNQLAQERCSSEDCQHCTFFYMCDGGCRYERYLAFGKDWPNKHLNATCKIMKIWHDAIERFLSQCRSDPNRTKLRELITRYKWWANERYDKDI